MAQRIDLTLGISADTSQAKREIAALKNELSKLGSVDYNFNNNKGIKEGWGTDQILKATQSARELKTMLTSAFNTDTGKLNLTAFTQSLKASGKTLSDYGRELKALGPQGQSAFRDVALSVASATPELTKMNGVAEKLWTTFKNVARYQISTNVYRSLTGALQNAYQYAQDLNKSLTDIRIVTGYSADRMAQFAVEANSAAQALSQTTNEYTKASLIYFQQGLSDAEVKARTDTTMKMAAVTGQSAQEVSDQMTAVWNNFAKGGENLESYSDKMTALGAATASSSSEIAQGLQQFSAIADTVGLSFDYAAAALTTVTATTRQSADTVGTAFKTLFARLEGLKLGETLDDGTDLTKYSQALATVGVNIKDTNGEIKAMDTIIDELGAKWKTLAKDQQIALAQTVAGMRQYNQLVALMDQFDFFKENLQTARESEGVLNEQFEAYEEGWEAASNRVRAAWEEIYQKIINSDFFISLLDSLEKFIKGISVVIDSLGGLKGTLGAIGLIATNLFHKQIAQGATSAAERMREVWNFATGKTQAEANKLKKDAFKVLEEQTGGSSESADVAARMEADRYKLQGDMVENLQQMTREQRVQYDLMIERRKAEEDYVRVLGDEKEKFEEINSEILKNNVLITKETAEKELTKRDKALDSEYKEKLEERDKWLNIDSKLFGQARGKKQDGHNYTISQSPEMLQQVEDWKKQGVFKELSEESQNLLDQALNKTKYVKGKDGFIETVERTNEERLQAIQEAFRVLGAEIAKKKTETQKVLTEFIEGTEKYNLPKQQEELKDAGDLFSPLQKRFRTVFSGTAQKKTKEAFVDQLKEWNKNDEFSGVDNILGTDFVEQFNKGFEQIDQEDFDAGVQIVAQIYENFVNAIKDGQREIQQQLEKNKIKVNDILDEDTQQAHLADLQQIGEMGQRTNTLQVRYAGGEISNKEQFEADVNNIKQYKKELLKMQSDWETLSEEEQQNKINVITEEEITDAKTLNKELENIKTTLEEIKKLRIDALQTSGKAARDVGIPEAPSDIDVDAEIEKALEGGKKAGEMQDKQDAVAGAHKAALEEINAQNIAIEQSFGQVVASGSQAISSITMFTGIIQQGKEVWGDGTVELQDFTVALSGVGAAVSSLQSISSLGKSVGDFGKLIAEHSLNAEKGAGAFGKLAQKLTEAGLGSAKAKSGLLAVGESGVSAAGGLASVAIYAAAVIAVLAALAAIIYVVYQAWTQQDRALKAAEETYKTLQENAAELNNSYTDLKNKLDELTTAEERFANADTPEAQKEALEDLNEQARELIENYNLVFGTDWKMGSKGEIEISTEARDRILKEREVAAREATAQASSAKAQFEIQQQNVQAQKMGSSLQGANRLEQTGSGKYQLRDTTMGDMATLLVGSVSPLIGALIAGVEIFSDKLSNNAQNQQIDITNQIAELIKERKEKNGGVDLTAKEIEDLMRASGQFEDVLIDNMIPAIEKNAESLNNYTDDLIQYGDMLLQRTRDQITKDVYEKYGEQVEKRYGDQSAGIMEALITTYAKQNQETQDTRRRELNSGAVEAKGYGEWSNRNVAEFISDNLGDLGKAFLKNYGEYVAGVNGNEGHYTFTDENLMQMFARNSLLGDYTYVSGGNGESTFKNNQTGELETQKDTVWRSLGIQGLIEQALKEELQLDDTQFQAFTGLVDQARKVGGEAGVTLADSITQAVANSEQVDFTDLIGNLDESQAAQLGQMDAKQLMGYFGFTEDQLKLMGFDTANQFFVAFQEKLKQIDDIKIEKEIQLIPKLQTALEASLSIDFDKSYKEEDLSFITEAGLSIEDYFAKNPISRKWEATINALSLSDDIRDRIIEINTKQINAIHKSVEAELDKVSKESEEAAKKREQRDKERRAQYDARNKEISSPRRTKQEKEYAQSRIRSGEEKESQYENRRREDYLKNNAISIQEDLETEQAIYQKHYERLNEQQRNRIATQKELQAESEKQEELHQKNLNKIHNEEEVSTKTTTVLTNESEKPEEPEYNFDAYQQYLHSSVEGQKAESEAHESFRSDRSETEALKEEAAQVEENTRVWGELAAQEQQYRQQIADSATSIDDLNDMLEKGQITALEYNDAHERMQDSQRLAGLKMEDVSEVAEGLAAQYNETNKELIKANPNLRKSAKDFADQAASILQSEKAIKDLKSNFKEWSQVIKNGNKAIEEGEKADLGYIQATGQMKKALGTLLDVAAEDIDNSFLSAENMDLLEKALNNDAEAAKKLQENFQADAFKDFTEQTNAMSPEQVMAVSDAFSQVGIEGVNSVQDILNKANELNGLWDNLQDPNFDTTSAINSLQAMLNSGQYTKEQLEKMYNIKIKSKPKTEKEPVKQKAPPNITETWTAKSAGKHTVVAGMDENNEPITYEEERFNWTKNVKVDEGQELTGYVEAYAANMTGDGSEPETPEIESISAGDTVGSRIAAAGGGKGTGSSGGGGGGGSSKKPKLKKADGKNRYHEVNKRLELNKDTQEDLSKTLSKLETQTQRTFGPSSVALIGKQIEVLQQENDVYDKQIELLKQRKAEAEAHRPEDAANLVAAGAKLGVSVEIDEEGVIKDYEAIMQKAMDYYNANVTGDSDADEQLNEDYEAFEKLASLYEDTMKVIMDTDNELEEAVEKKAEKLRAIFDQKLSMIQISVEYKLEITENVKSYYDYIDARTDDWIDSLEKVEAVSAQVARQQEFIAKNTADVKDAMKETLTLGEVDSGLISEFMNKIDKREDYTEAYQKIADSLQNAADPINGKELLEQLNGYTSQMLGYWQDAFDQESRMFDAQVALSEKMREQLDKQYDKIVDRYEDISNKLDVFDGIGAGFSQASANVINQYRDEQIEIIREERDFLDQIIQQNQQEKENLEKQREQLIKERDQTTSEARKAELNIEIGKVMEQIETISDAIDDKMNERRAKIGELADLVRERFSIAVNNIVANFDKAIAGSFGNLEALSKAYDQKQQLQEQYIPEYKQVYELNKINRDIAKQIESTDNLSAQKKLRDFQKEIYDLQNSGKKLSDYDLEYLQKKYDLRVAEIALEDAQNQKNMVRLSRDAEGNYSYVYTADESAESDAAGNYEDKLYAMQELNQESLKNNASEYLSLLQEQSDALRALGEMDLTPAEFQKQQEQIVEYYAQRGAFLSEQNEAILNNNKTLYDEDYAAFEGYSGMISEGAEAFRMTQADFVSEFQETTLGQLLDGYESMSDHASSVLTALSGAENSAMQQIAGAYVQFAASMEEIYNMLGEQYNPYEQRVQTGEEKIRSFIGATEDEYESYKQTAETSLTAIGDAMGKNTNRIYTELKASGGVDEMVGGTGTAFKDVFGEDGTIREAIAAVPGAIKANIVGTGEDTINGLLGSIGTAATGTGTSIQEMVNAVAGGADGTSSYLSTLKEGFSTNLGEIQTAMVATDAENGDSTTFQGVFIKVGKELSGTLKNPLDTELTDVENALIGKADWIGGAYLTDKLSPNFDSLGDWIKKTDAGGGTYKITDALGELAGAAEGVFGGIATWLMSDEKDGGKQGFADALGTYASTYSGTEFEDKLDHYRTQAISAFGKLSSSTGIGLDSTSYKDWGTAVGRYSGSSLSTFASDVWDSISDAPGKFKGLYDSDTGIGDGDGNTYYSGWAKAVANWMTPLTNLTDAIDKWEQAKKPVNMPTKNGSINTDSDRNQLQQLKNLLDELAKDKYKTFTVASKDGTINTKSEQDALNNYKKAWDDSHELGAIQFPTVENYDTNKKKLDDLKTLLEGLKGEWIIKAKTEYDESHSEGSSSVYNMDAYEKGEISKELLRYSAMLMNQNDVNSVARQIITKIENARGGKRLTANDALDIEKLLVGDKDSFTINGKTFSLADFHLSKYATGGYTGEWGDSGKLAVLHEKELVLNKTDTSNILQAVDMIRQLADSIDLSAKIEQATIGARFAFNMPKFDLPNQELNQNVTIYADFPGVSVEAEIQQAFNSMEMSALQYANQNY